MHGPAVGFYRFEGGGYPFNLLPKLSCQGFKVKAPICVQFQGSFR